MLKTEEYCVRRGFKTAYLTTHDQQVGAVYLEMSFACNCVNMFALHQIV